MNYFAHPAVSNSNFKQLQRCYNALAPLDASNNLDFGNLVDSMLTGEGEIKGSVLYCEDGRVVTFTDQEIRLAGKLSEYCHKDNLVKLMLPGGTPQKVVIRNVLFNYEGREFDLEAKCKIDWSNEFLRTNIDYKTTACTTYKSFIASIDHFDYDQQGAFYLDVSSETERMSVTYDYHWIIGMSKPTGKIFRYVIERGDENYKRGQKKYLYWANKWDLFINNFNV